jgi:hypothetical protein
MVVKNSKGKILSEKSEQEIKSEKKQRMRRINQKAFGEFNMSYDDLTQEQQEWAENEVDIEDETEVWD